MTHADEVMMWLKELGYSHCFFVAGGNSMHLLNSARNTMKCVPFVHEVSAGIAAEYFNETGISDGRAFVLVTAGPGLTNLVTALAGAFLESRELLVIGGQVKSSDLAEANLRQRGIQEVDGVGITKSITKSAIRVEKPLYKESFVDLVNLGITGRPGPIFFEYCLDAQGVIVGELTERQTYDSPLSKKHLESSDFKIDVVLDLLQHSVCPVLLVGGGVTRSAMERLLAVIRESGLPVMTTWNAADRIDSDEESFFGRPNTWGQRSSNILIQQSDLCIAVGTRLGLQQTGFNWQQFVPRGKVVHVDIDPIELSKGHPHVDVAVCADAELFLTELLSKKLALPRWDNWSEHCRKVRKLLPLSEKSNTNFDGFLNPFDFALRLSEICIASDIIVPCSSGGAFTVMMQAFNQKYGQIIVTDKGLASMGYGLAGAIGAALSDDRRRTVLVEGDGGFSQNLQELATVDVQNLNLKIFIFSNEGYASIRMTQKNYFDGAYLGCDTTTGLGFPDWKLLASAFGLSSSILKDEDFASDEFKKIWDSDRPHIFIVPIHPEQSFFPKITSRVTANGGMESAPLHEMSPTLSNEMLYQVEL